MNDTFNITIGTIGPVTYTITIPPRNYTLASLAGKIAAILNAEPTGKTFTVTYDDSATAGQKRYTITDISSTATTEVCTLDFSKCQLGKTLGFQQTTYGVGNPSKKYQAETTNLAENDFPTTIVTLPQGYYNLDRVTDTLQSLFPFCGGSAEALQQILLNTLLGLYPMIQ